MFFVTQKKRWKEIIYHSYHNIICNRCEKKWKNNLKRTIIPISSYRVTSLHKYYSEDHNLKSHSDACDS